MFPSMMRRPGPPRRRVTDSANSLSLEQSRRVTANFMAQDDAEDDDEEEEDDDVEADRSFPRFGRPTRLQVPGDRDDDDDDDQDDDHDDGEDGRPGGLPVLPLFSSSHLDSIPVYGVTHAIRIIVCARIETTLPWEQLRSPQVSQFLVKPMQRQIRSQHFSRGTLYALMANCLQFTKEAQRYAANAGISNTRARVCELLALKILKEYSTRELIDALAYDFYPLEGLAGVSSAVASADNSAASRARGGAAAAAALSGSRSSTLEVAIRASAKHFLAHPVVIQQLEAIWNGAITFYSSADSLHREAPAATAGPAPAINGGATKVDATTPLLGVPSSRQAHPHVPPGRRTVMLYDPRQASMLKLSRLRVPRYRSFLSTISLAILIGLFLAVLIQRSVKITALELVFWFWSAGFMLDELVGFNEQGFALYIMSVWNLFDLGILVLLIAYYCMRVYGVFMVDPHHWNDMAYDVLAANAILLLPRIFSILDHYQYFSQLLIAFRLMAVDLVAVLILVLILCSGFYVFFTLSNNTNQGADVAYKIFQLLMGFTPAAWDVWPTYNWLGRGLLVIFLFFCHFLVVTILITVLTNSFMAIASNATEEHQFLFAINTISMVKNDALFSYIAPSNIFAWLLMPLRYFMPLGRFVWLNRTIIKITHFPVLFCIYLYERLWLAPSMFEPTDLVEHPSQGRGRTISFADPAHRSVMFSPNVRVREESVAGFHKDRALEEMFRRMPEATTLRTQRRNERQKAQTAIRNWMDQHEEDGASASNWPTLDSRAVPEWQRRLSSAWDRPSNLRQVSEVRSTASDPADLLSNIGGLSSIPKRSLRKNLVPMAEDYKDHTDADADGDDELVTNDEDEDDNVTNEGKSRRGGAEMHEDEEGDYFTTPMTSRTTKPSSSSPSGSGQRPAVSIPAPVPIPASPRPPTSRRVGMHNRTLSTNTILYNPESEESSPGSRRGQGSPPRSPGKHHQGSGRQSGRSGGEKTPGRRHSPRRTGNAAGGKLFGPPIGPRGVADGAVSRTALRSIEPLKRPRSGRRDSVDLGMLSDNTSLRLDNDNHTGDMAGSFQTQMAMAMMKDNQRRAGGAVDAADRDRMGRLVLARMKTLEESFADMIREMRDMKERSQPASRWNSSDDTNSRHHQQQQHVSQKPQRRKAKGDSTPRKSATRRPDSRRSMKESRPGTSTPRDSKGKGKAASQWEDSKSDADESQHGEGGSG